MAQHTDDRGDETTGKALTQRGRRDRHTIRMRQLNCAFPPEWLDALAAAADARRVSRPELLREIVGAWLKEQAVVPPEPEEHAKDER